MNIVQAGAWLGAMGLAFGVTLGICAKYFAVETDERLPNILDALPMANCGGCGYAGCSAYATAVVSGKAAINLCNAGGQACADRLGAIMGVAVERQERQTARVMCAGTGNNAVNKYNYDGEPDCVSASMLGGGYKACTSGCLGFGNCVKACVFDAISIKDGVAVVNENNCTACGQCVKKCPKGIIALTPYDSKVYVACSNKEKGVVVKNECAVGCIACRLCVKNCPNGAITIENNLAKVDPTKCDDCRKCLEVCPKRIIRLRHVASSVQRV